MLNFGTALTRKKLMTPLPDNLAPAPPPASAPPPSTSAATPAPTFVVIGQVYVLSKPEVHASLPRGSGHGKDL